MASIQLSARASRLARKGRMWYYADDLARVDAEHGALVRVRCHHGREIGLGLYSTTSRLALRLCGPLGEAPSSAAGPEPEAYFAQRVADAVARRAAVPELAAPRAAVRVVHGEADGLPGLAVDRYADCLVLQCGAAALEVHLGGIVSTLVELLEPRSVLARNDLAVRELEGLPREIELLHGRRVEVVDAEEGGLTLGVRLFAGQKTGLYLDQRPARRFVRETAGGRAVLDLFAYQGGFSLAALRGGAASALAVDQSAEALACASADARRNRLEGLEVRAANAFSVLRELRAAGRRFDLVVVDPPPFARSRREVQGGVRGYRELNRQALRILGPGGVLVTCSCSYHLTQPMFEDVLRQAAAELPFRPLLRRRSQAGEDHPVLLALPESEYLKVVVLERPER